MGFDAITLYRWGRMMKQLNIPLLPKVVGRINFYLHNSYIPISARIGEGTAVGYGGMGIVIHEDARVGRHCLISQQVTIGGRSGVAGAPVIGDGVRIGAGAKILGNVTVGDFAVIGANAVVIRDVAPGAVVVGVPAHEVRRLEDPIGAYERDLGRAPGLLS